MRTAFPMVIAKNYEKNAENKRKIINDMKLYFYLDGLKRADIISAFKMVMVCVCDSFCAHSSHGYRSQSQIVLKTCRQHHMKIVWVN